MVLWCKKCGAFVGLREPLTNWTVDKDGVCARCVEKGIGLKVDQPNALIDTVVEAKPLPNDLKI